MSLSACGEISGGAPGGADGSGAPGSSGGPDSSQDRAPEIAEVSISPSAIYVDGPATCSASYSDPDGDAVSASYTWTNATRGTTLGAGETITLSPGKIRPDELLTCSVTVTDPSGNAAHASASVTPSCGLYDLNDLASINFAITIYFRPWATEDLVPGYGGEPWDWDGTVPGELFQLASQLNELLGLINTVYPTPETLTAEETLEYLIQIGYLVEDVAPVLLEETVPPDPDLYPYLVDSEGYITTYWEGEGLRWSDSYEVELSAEQQDLLTYDYFVLDMEDIDLLFDDNMGDWIDQGTDPLLLGWPIFSEGAYCTSSYVNPTELPQTSEVAFVPSSILWMQIEIW